MSLQHGLLTKIWKFCTALVPNWGKMVQDCTKDTFPDELKPKFLPQMWLKISTILGIWLTLASPGHFFTFRVFNMELGCIRRDCDTAKVRRNEKSMHFLRFKFGVISRPNILLTGRKPTKHPKVPRKCQKHCQTPCLDGHHWYYVFYPLFKSFEYLFGLNYPQKPLKRSWLK